MNPMTPERIKELRREIIECEEYWEEGFDSTVIKECLDEIERLTAELAASQRECEKLSKENLVLIGDLQSCQTDNARLEAALGGLVKAIDTCPMGTAGFADAYEAAKEPGTALRDALAPLADKLDKARFGPTGNTEGWRMVWEVAQSIRTLCGETEQKKGK